MPQKETPLIKRGQLKRNLSIVGAIHIDPKGEENLKAKLQELRPETILLEMTEERAGWNRHFYEQLSQELSTEELRTIRPFLEYASQVTGYELRAPNEYVLQNQETKLEFIDADTISLDDFVRCMKIGIKASFLFYDLEKINPRELFQKLSNKSYSQYEQGTLMGTDELYQKLSSLRGSYVESQKRLNSPVRNDTMASNIKRLYNPKESLVAIVGLTHLKDLGRRLKDLNPQLIPLG